MAHIFASEARQFFILTSFLRLFFVFRYGCKHNAIIWLCIYRMPSLFGHPFSSLQASLMVLKNGSLLCSTAFSISSMIFPYLCRSAIYRNNLGKIPLWPFSLHLPIAHLLCLSHLLSSVLPWPLALSDPCIAPVDHRLVSLKWNSPGNFVVIAISCIILNSLQ